MTQQKKPLIDRWIDDRMQNILDSGTDKVTRKFRLIITIFYLATMLIYATYCVVMLNDIGQMSDTLMMIFGIGFYVMFAIMGVLSLWVILRIHSGVDVNLDKLKKLHIATKILRRVLALVTYVITLVTMFKTWDNGMVTRLFSCMIMLTFSIINIAVIVMDIHKKKLKKLKKQQKEAEKEARKQQALTYKIKNSTLSNKLSKVVKKKDNSLQIETKPIKEKEVISKTSEVTKPQPESIKPKIDTEEIASGVVDGIRVGLSTWENKFQELLNLCYDKAIIGIPNVEEPAIECANKYMQKYSNVNLAITKYSSYQTTKCATSGFVTGLGGLITLPIAVPANLASVLYIQIRTVITIATMYGNDPTEEEIRALTFACLTGNAMSDLLKSVGINIDKDSILLTPDKMPLSLIAMLNKKVCTRFITKAGEKGITSFSKFLPVVGGIVGGTVDVISINTIISNAKKVFSINSNEEEILQPIDTKKWWKLGKKAK